MLTGVLANLRRVWDIKISSEILKESLEFIFHLYDQKWK